MIKGRVFVLHVPASVAAKCTCADHCKTSASQSSMSLLDNPTILQHLCFNVMPTAKPRSAQVSPVHRHHHHPLLLVLPTVWITHVHYKHAQISRTRMIKCMLSRHYVSSSRHSECNPTHHAKAAAHGLPALAYSSHKTPELSMNSGPAAACDA
jgi:hypothetical protein